MPTKITVQKWMVRGQTKWAVHRVEAGKRKRAFFDSKKAAEAEAGLLRSQQAAVGGAWLALPASERQRLVQVHHEAKELGVDLADLLADWKRSPRFTGSSPALEYAITELLNAKSSNRYRTGNQRRRRTLLPTRFSSRVCFCHPSGFGRASPV